MAEVTLGLYFLTLVAAVLIGIQLPASAGLVIAFAFVCWLGGWCAHDLYHRRH